MNLAARHPRYTIGMAAGLLCTLLLLASQPRPSLRFAPPSRWPGGPHALSVKEKMDRQEDSYVRMVQNRHALIRKYGPTPEEIKTFPESAKAGPYMMWDFFPPAFNCPYETERIGVMGDGGKWVCGLSRLVEKPDCIVYSAGISTESSFEAEIIRRTKCEVFGFDFSVTKFGPEIENYGSIRSKAHFYPYGISGKDDHDAHPPMWALQTLMREHGHTFIDILKIDIEGSEFAALSSMIKYYKDRKMPLPFGQLQLEIHVDQKPFAEFLHWWEDLEEAGLRPFFTEPNLLYISWLRGATPSYTEYSFLNIGLHHNVILD